MEQKNMKVSIVVPVYNVENYISECITSLISQTYSNLEIICIDDCSPDSSYKICKSFEDKDSRVKAYKNSCNKGQGFTRNRGVDVSHGDFLFFMDSDDWLPDDAIAKLLDKAIKEDADICIGAMSHFNQITGEYYVGWRDVNDEFALKTYLNWSMCNKLYRNSFYMGNKIRQYEGTYEDPATYPIMMKLAQKISLVKEVTYYYRRFSGKSTMDNWKNALNTKGAIEFMVSSFQERNYSVKDRHLYNAAFTLARASLGQLRGCVREGKCQAEVYNKFKAEMDNCLSDLFPDYSYEKIWLFGSANLNRIYRDLVLEYYPNELTTPMYNFSSIISAVSDCDVYSDIFHEKIFRKNMLKKDWKKLIWEKNDLKPRFLLMDFIDERYDIIDRGGFYYTKSEVFEEAYFDGSIEPYSVISRKSIQCKELWEVQCRKFVDKIKSFWPDCKIILVELYLTNSYMLDGEKIKWKNEIYIKETNEMLKDYYTFIKNVVKNLKVVSIDNEKAYTDAKFVYGCYPWYYNNQLYIDLLEKVREAIYE